MTNTTDSLILVGPTCGPFQTEVKYVALVDAESANLVALTAIDRSTQTYTVQTLNCQAPTDGQKVMDYLTQVMSFYSLPSVKVVDTNAVAQALSIVQDPNITTSVEAKLTVSSTTGKAQYSGSNLKALNVANLKWATSYVLEFSN